MGLEVREGWELEGSMRETFWSEDNILFLGLDGGIHMAADCWAEIFMHFSVCMFYDKKDETTKQKEWLAFDIKMKGLVLG